jgi:hypothetical protein
VVVLSVRRYADARSLAEERDANRFVCDFRRQEPKFTKAENVVKGRNAAQVMRSEG